MVSISALDITYGDALGPLGFHSVATDSGIKADLNKGNNNSPTYLWCKENGSDYIKDICIVHDDEKPPEGFDKITKNLTRGAPTRAFICFSRTSEQLGSLAKIRILFDKDTPEKKWSVLDSVVCPSSECQVKISYRRCDEKDISDRKWSAYDLNEGDWVDCKDTVNKWCVAKVVKVTETEVTIHYKGWSSKYDDTMSKDSSKLAKVGTHTSGKDTGNDKRQQGVRWDLTKAQLIEMVSRVEKECASEDHNENFWKGELPEFVEQCMSSTLTDAELASGDAVNDFLVQLMKYFVGKLSQTEPLTAESRRLGLCLFGADSRCSWFYTQYGLEKEKASKPADSAALAAERSAFAFARVPPPACRGRQPDVSHFFVKNLNVFGGHGGFELVLQRIGGGIHRGESSLTTPRVTTRSGGAVELPRASLTEVAVLVQLLSHSCYCCGGDFAAEYFPRFLETLMARIR